MFALFIIISLSQCRLWINRI